MTFIRSDKAEIVSVSDAQIERFENIQDLIGRMEELQPFVHDAILENGKRSGEEVSKSRLPDFLDGNYVLVEQEEFFEGKIFCFRWKGPYHVIKALNEFVFDVEDLISENIDPIHGSRLKYSSDSSKKRSLCCMLSVVKWECQSID